MACFDEFITYEGSGVTPTSGLYVNDLYGVNQAKINAVANSDHASGTAFIEDKISHAITLVSSELRRYVMPYFKLNSMIGHYLGGEFDDDLEYHSSRSGYGLRLDIDETTLSEMYINRVTILADTTGDVTLRITDGEETTDETVTLAAGEEQTVELNYRCNRKRVYITIETAYEPAKGDVSKCCEGNYKGLTVKGYTGSGVTSKHYGIRANVSVVCSLSNLACLLKDIIGLAILYRFGIILASETLETDRFNYFTLVNKDDIQELKQSYQADYDKEMQDVARTIPKLLRKLDSYCIECNQDKYYEVTP